MQLDQFLCEKVTDCTLIHYYNNHLIVIKIVWRLNYRDKRILFYGSVRMWVRFSKVQSMTLGPDKSFRILLLNSLCSKLMSASLCWLGEPD